MAVTASITVTASIEDDGGLHDSGIVTALRVLIVDPYRAGRDALCECVAELGHEAFGAPNIDEATKLLRQASANLVVVDHSPPWIDGWHCVDVLRAEEPGIAAIVLLEIEAPSAWMTVALLKPVSLVALERAIARCGRLDVSECATG